MSRGDTKNVCLLFNSLLPPGKSEKGERERRKNVSLFSKKTLSFSLSLFLFSSFSFFLRYVLAVDSFFFPLFCTSFRRVKSKRWSSLSFSLVFVGEIGNHIRLSLSLSLLRRARFGKPDLPIEHSAAHAEREGSSSLRKKRSTPPIHSRAKAGEKKRWIGFLLIAAQEHRSHK